jgi:cyclophilin family peptidyl-prolyl cis-trans isomerase
MFTPAIAALLLLASSPSPAQTTTVPGAPIPVPQVKPTPDGPVIAIDTTMGTIEVGLYATRAPLSTRNIMNYVRSGFYNGTVFHRVIPGFMVQGGGLDANMNEKPVGPPVRNEARNGLLNSRGSLSLARTKDPHSATSQFFISVKDNPALDFGISRDGWGYAVFGEVLSGMEVVDQIVAVPTSTRGPHQNVPIKTGDDHEGTNHFRAASSHPSRRHQGGRSRGDEAGRPAARVPEVVSRGPAQADTLPVRPIAAA